MEKQVNQVLEFYEAFKHPIATSPKWLSNKRVVMRHSLLQEEVTELLQAGADGTLVDVADAITDCLYIIIGTAIEYGIADKLPQLFDEVHRSNMSKLDSDGNPIYREDGKVLKSDKYTPPNLKDIVY